MATRGNTERIERLRGVHQGPADDADRRRQSPGASALLEHVGDGGRAARAPGERLREGGVQGRGPDLIEQVIRPMIPAQFANDDYSIFINPTGKFVLGGPHADTGLTGRKIIVDTYGGMGRHGGGAFSGKDPSKVDRSAAYASRWVAKHVVASGAADRCEVQVAYAIGMAHPVSILVETFGTEKVAVEKIEAAVRATFDLRPAAIVRDLQLKRPIYQQTAAYGHFGRELADFEWEKLSRLSEFSAALGR